MRDRENERNDGRDIYLEKLARIDTNVRILMNALPKLEELVVDSAVNKKEHKLAVGIATGVAIPVVMWILKKLTSLPIPL